MTMRNWKQLLLHSSATFGLNKHLLFITCCKTCLWFYISCAESEFHSMLPQNCGNDFRHLAAICTGCQEILLLQCLTETKMAWKVVEVASAALRSSNFSLLSFTVPDNPNERLLSGGWGVGRWSKHWRFCLLMVNLLVFLGGGFWTLFTILSCGLMKGRQR